VLWTQEPSTLLGWGSSDSLLSLRDGLSWGGRGWKDGHNPIWTFLSWLHPSFFTFPTLRSLLRLVVEAVSVPCALPATVAKEFGEEVRLGLWGGRSTYTITYCEWRWWWWWWRWFWRFAGTLMGHSIINKMLLFC
jgi:hypothetical protein